MAKRTFIMVELPMEADRDAFKLWCQVNGYEMGTYIRQLIEQPIREGKEMLSNLRNRGKKNEG